MKKHISLVLAIAMLATLALTACDSSSDTTTPAPGSSGTPAQSTSTPAESSDPAATNGNEDPATTTSPDDPDPTPDDPFDSLFRKYATIDNLESYKTDHANLTSLYFSEIVMSQSIFSGNDWTGTEQEEFEGLGNEDAPNLFDCDPKTKWCCARDLVELGKSAVVWKMDQQVTVTAYSFTTANDNDEWTSRNPVQWRIYGCNELPETYVTDENPDEGDTYLATFTVPDGWTLVDAMDASDPSDGVSSMLPDENFKEIGFELKEAVTFQYFMLIIDYVEINDTTFQLADLTLYGNDN